MKIRKGDPAPFDSSLRSSLKVRGETRGGIINLESLEFI